MNNITITGHHLPFYGVEGNTHNVYEFCATSTDKAWGYLYCADTWSYEDAEVEFTDMAGELFGAENEM